MKFKAKKESKYFLILFIIFLIGLWFRLLVWPDKMLFGYEQGRDALRIREIITGEKLTLIGPKTDLGGIFHGALYYYLLIIPYYLGGGSPVWAGLFLMILSSGAVFVAYFLGQQIFDKKTGLIAACLTALSFDLIVYSRWLSNVNLSILTTFLFFLFLEKYIRGEKKALIWLALFYGLSLHFEILLGLTLLFVFGVISWLKKPPLPNKKTFVLSGLVLFFFCSPFLLFELRHKFIMSKSIFSYFGKGTGERDALRLFYEYFSLMVELFKENIFSFSAVISLGLFFWLAIWLKKNFYRRRSKYTFLIVSLSVSLPSLLLIREGMLRQFVIGVEVPIILLFAHFLAEKCQIKKKMSYLFLFLFFLGSSIFAYNSLRSGESIFYHTTQKGYYYKDQLELINYLLDKHKDGQFVWRAFTLPFYHEEAWEYLFSWKGYPIDERYKEHKNRYLIIEPNTQGFHLGQWTEEEDKISKLSAEKKFGSIILQERVAFGF